MIRMLSIPTKDCAGVTNAADAAEWLYNKCGIHTIAAYVHNELVEREGLQQAMATVCCALVG